MINGWFVFTLVACIVICCGFVLAIVIMRASWASREREALTSSDLRALEESALVLIDQLKSEADSGISELDRRCAELKELISEADKKISELRNASMANPQIIRELIPDEVCINDTKIDDSRKKVLALASSGMDSADIARTTGLDCAEVKLILSLEKL